MSLVGSVQTTSFRSVHVNKLMRYLNEVVTLGRARSCEKSHQRTPSTIYIVKTLYDLNNFSLSYVHICGWKEWEGAWTLPSMNRITQTEPVTF
jgi:hypothetical protein